MQRNEAEEKYRREGALQSHMFVNPSVCACIATLNIQRDGEVMDQSLVGNKHKTSGKRHIDSFLDELKRDQEVRDRSDGKMSFITATDVNDVSCTTLYITGIHPTVCTIIVVMTTDNT